MLFKYIFIFVIFHSYIYICMLKYVLEEILQYFIYKMHNKNS